MTKLEEVARAIYGKHVVGGAWEDAPKMQRLSYLMDVRAAVEALVNPTTEMKRIMAEVTEAGWDLSHDAYCQAMRSILAEPRSTETKG